MKQLRYTQGRMAERSKAPDSRNSPLRLLVHECVRGFESHSCQSLRSKSQLFGRSSSSESQIKKKTKQISHYKKVLPKTGWSKCDILKAGWPSGLRRQTQEILLWDFWDTNVCVGSNPTPVKFCVQKGNILIEAVSNPTPVPVSSESQMRSKRNKFHITRRCYRRQVEASAIYSRQDGRAV